jgi:cysteinyl-tRNA synthetase
MSGRKMSKSAGNFQRITELAEEGLDPLAFRYLCLTARYGRKLNFSDESLAGAAAGLASLRAELAALGPAPSSGPWAAPAPLRAGSSGDRPSGRAEGVAGHGGDPRDGSGGAEVPLADRAHVRAVPLSEEGGRLHDAFVAAFDDDLDLPVALRIARATLRADLEPDERRWLVLDFDFVLGLDLDRAVDATTAAASAATALTAELSAEASELLAARTRARADRDFASADRLRDQLRELGIEPIDRADGSSDWRRLD